MAKYEMLGIFALNSVAFYYSCSYMKLPVINRGTC